MRALLFFFSLALAWPSISFGKAEDQTKRKIASTGGAPVLNKEIRMLSVGGTSWVRVICPNVEFLSALAANLKEISLSPLFVGSVKSTETGFEIKLAEGYNTFSLKIPDSSGCALLHN